MKKFFIANKLRALSYFFVSITVLGMGFPLVSGEYAKGDDYVFLGISSPPQWTASEMYSFMASAPWNGGRNVTNFLLSLEMHFTRDVGGIFWLRFLGLLSVLVFSILFFEYLKVLNLSILVRLQLSIGLLCLPGTYALLTFGTVWNYLFASILTLTASRMLIDSSFTVRTKYAFVLILLLVATFSYQPSATLIFVFPILHWIYKTNARRQHFFEANVSFVLALLVNATYVRLRFPDSRAFGTIDFFDKLRYLENYLLPNSIAPFTNIFLGVGRQSLYISLTLLTLNFAMTLSIVKQNKTQFIGLQRIAIEGCRLMLVGLGYLPVTLIMFMLVADSGGDYRRVYWASLVFLITFVALLNRMLLNSWFSERQKSVNFIHSFLIVVIFSIALLSSSFFNRNTAELSRAEWSAAKCASREVKLEGGAVVSRDIVVNARPPSKINGMDDFALYSMGYSNPPTAIIWLSQKYYWETPGDQYFEMREPSDPDGVKWAGSFAQCLNNEIRH
jgi:hypothetical protein